MPRGRRRFRASLSRSLPEGLTEAPPRTAGAATLSGSAIWCTAIALVGYELGGEWTRITKGFSAAGYVLVALVVVVIVAFVLHRYAAVRRERATTRH